MAEKKKLPTDLYALGGVPVEEAVARERAKAAAARATEEQARGAEIARGAQTSPWVAPTKAAARRVLSAVGLGGAPGEAAPTPAQAPRDLAKERHDNIWSQLKKATREGTSLHAAVAELSPDDMATLATGPNASLWSQLLKQAKADAAQDAADQEAAAVQTNKDAMQLR